MCGLSAQSLLCWSSQLCWRVFYRRGGRAESNQLWRCVMTDRDGKSKSQNLGIEKEAKSWAAIGAWTSGGQNVGTNSEPLRVTAAGITRGLIDALGVQPAMGRNFSPEEDRNGGGNVVIISY